MRREPPNFSIQLTLAWIRTAATNSPRTPWTPTLAAEKNQLMTLLHPMHIDVVRQQQNGLDVKMLTYELAPYAWAGATPAGCSARDAPEKTTVHQYISISCDTQTLTSSRAASRSTYQRYVSRTPVDRLI